MGESTTAAAVWRDPRAAALIRQNLGTIIDIETLKVRFRGHGAPLGEVEESFAATLTPGDTFLIGEARFVARAVPKT